MNREQRRAARKAMSKSEREASDFVNSAIENTPMSCTRCGESFDRTSQESLDTWTIHAYSEGNIELICPNCNTGDNR